MNINQEFINAIGNNKKIKVYVAHMQLVDGDIGITGAYTLKTLKKSVIPEAQSFGHKLLRIVEKK